MKNKIQKFSKGDFQSLKPEITFDETNLVLIIGEGEVFRGNFTLKTTSEVSIARVFLKNPPILIFDEATSALDNESEKVVQESLEKLAKNRTTLVIAHRLTTIRNAEKILVLSENGIEEQGTHDELINKHGIYYDLYNVNN